MTDRLMSSTAGRPRSDPTRTLPQVASWPQQPLALAAAWLASRPHDFEVADFGCGTGELATRVKQVRLPSQRASPSSH